MPSGKTVFLLIAIAASSLALLPNSSAEAQTFTYLQKTYKVEVEYWFFDTDYYYWGTVFESSDHDEAEFVYNLLQIAKANGQLNQAAPNSYWRYIAVDVRMTTEYHFPRYMYREWYSDLMWFPGRTIYAGGWSRK